jgi:hypothetical protein
MRLRRPAAFAVALALTGLPACQPGTPIQTNGAPAATPGPSASPLPLGVVFGQLRLPAAVVASAGGSIVAQGGGNIISHNGGTLVAQGGGNIVAQGGGTLISTNGGGIVAQGGGNIVAQGGGNIVAQGGGNIVAQGGGNIVAQGGGNIVAQGGGNLVAAGTGQIISTNGGSIIVNGGGNIVSHNGGTIVASSGANIVAQGGGNIVAQGGGNIVAQGGGNLVGNSGGTYRHLAQATDVIDALAIQPSGLIDPLVAPGESHPIAHAVVYLTDADGQPLPGAPYAVTDDQGYYFFAGLPTNKPVIATSPFLPTGIKGNIVAQGGGNIVAQGGGNIVPTGGGNIVAQGGGNLVGNSGGTYGLLDAGPVLEQEVVKASPKVLALPTTVDHLPADAGAGVAAIASRNGVNLPGASGYHALDAHTNNGDISLATTITSNLLLAGQKGQVVELDQHQFDVVVDRVEDVLLSAPLSTVFQPLPQVPLLVDLQKLDLPEGTDLTFRQRDQELAANEQARKQAEAELAKLEGDAKLAKEAELAKLEADAKRVAQEKVNALFDLANRVKDKLGIQVKTDEKPVDATPADGSDGRTLPTDAASTSDPGPAATPAPTPEPVATSQSDGLPSEPEPSPSPSWTADGSINVVPGTVNDAGTEAIP